MSNIIDATGITVKTLSEVITAISSTLKIAYGDDINIASDSPDGQLINIFAQSIVDNEDLLTQIYNGFDPDQAIGVTLDQRVAINGIQRLGATYTITNVTITTDRALNLAGLDSLISDPNGTGFTVADSNGNKFILASSIAIGSAGSYPLAFRSQNSGAVLTTPNTITTPVTIVLGVTAVTNPTSYTTLGLDEETDAALRLRRQKSVSLASQGYLQALLASLLNISGVTYAAVYENTTGTTDISGVPGHSIWCIVAGGSSSDIGYAIYTKRNAGCGMKGSQTVNITQVNGSTFQVLFDRTATQPLYTKFSAHSIDGVTAISTTILANGLVTGLNMGVNTSINVNEVASIILSLDQNCLATNIEVSADNSTWLNIVSPTAKNYQFTLSASDVAITII